ncbi:MAG: DinB family protein [Planctomycetota bacterium]
MEADLRLLERTPLVLEALLSGLDETESVETEGWDPKQVLGHLLHGERSDWMARVRIILDSEGGRFEAFDRDGHRAICEGRTIDSLLEEFAAARAENLTALMGLELTGSDLERTGLHPELGTVTLRQLLTTWVAHDLTHLAQIARCMAGRLKGGMGPWTAYFKSI